MTIAGRVDRKTETWSSRFGFIMAAVGSSVGLGNIWRFTYTTGENGGGAFVLAYLACMILVAFPLLCAEYAIGRRSGHSAVESVQALARASGKSELWGGVAWVGSLTAFFILTFYCVVSSWLMAYAPLAFSGDFGADAGRGALEASEARFDAVTGNVPLMLLCLAVFIAAAACRGRPRRPARHRARIDDPDAGLHSDPAGAAGLCGGRRRARQGGGVPHHCPAAGFLLRHDARRAVAILLRHRRRRGGDDHLRRLHEARHRHSGLGRDRRRRRHGCRPDRGADGVLAGLRRGLGPGRRLQPVLRQPADRPRRHAGWGSHRRCLLPARPLRRAGLIGLADGSGGLLAGRTHRRNPLGRGAGRRLHRLRDGRRLHIFPAVHNFRRLHRLVADDAAWAASWWRCSAAG